MILFESLSWADTSDDDLEIGARYTHPPAPVPMGIRRLI
jgi:hypothetical protein